MTPRSLFRAFIRTLIILLALTVILLTAASFLLDRLTQIGPPLGPTPPPPTINAPRGELPLGPVGLQEWPQYKGAGYELVGSGFLLLLKDGTVVGVTTAHSVASLGNPGHALEHIAFALPGHTDHVAEFEALYGRPGLPRVWADLSVDYVLLKVTQPIDPSLVLTPDPRGAPQPGERVTLFSGQGDGGGGPRPLEGTVMTADQTGIWVLMDQAFEAGRMSGSPLLSQHTGRVVGMAVVVAHRGDRVMIGFHPIGHIVQIAEAADVFPKIAGYLRRLVTIS